MCNNCSTYENSTIVSFVLWILCIMLLYFTVLLCGFNPWNYVMCKSIPIPWLGFANPSAHLEDKKRSRWMLLCIIICDHKPWHLTGVQCQIYFYVGIIANSFLLWSQEVASSLPIPFSRRQRCLISPARRRISSGKSFKHRASVGFVSKTCGRDKETLK